MSPYTHHLTNAQLERLALALSDLTDALDAQETEDTELLEACWALPAENGVGYAIGRKDAVLHLIVRLNERLDEK